MAETYQMKDLGYPRTPTTAKIILTCTNGDMWEIPAQLAADSRDEHYKNSKEDTVKDIRQGVIDDSELLDWAWGYLNWVDVEKFATKLDVPKLYDMQEEWINGELDVTGAV